MNDLIAGMLSFAASVIIMVLLLMIYPRFALRLPELFYGWNICDTEHMTETA